MLSSFSSRFFVSLLASYGLLMFSLTASSESSSVYFTPAMVIVLLQSTACIAFTYHYTY